MSEDEVKVGTFFELVPEGNRISGASRFSNVPKPRSGHRMVTDNEGNLYSFGGYNPRIDYEEQNEHGENNGIFQELWKFNRTTLTWKKLKTTGDPPVHLASHCAILVDNCLIVYGGTGVPFGANCSNDIHVCCLKTLEWKKIIPENSFKPLQQYGQAITYNESENVIYTVGGTTGFSYTIDVHKFDFRKKIWTMEWKKPGYDGPAERYRHEIVFYKENIYVFGGGTAEDCFDFQKIPVYRTAFHDWDVVVARSSSEDENAFPERRRCHGCVQIDQFVYIVGGLHSLHGVMRILSDVWKLDLETFEWTLLPCRMPKPAYFHSASVSPLGLMTIFGGVVSTASNIRTNALWGLWLKVPPLQELAWNSVLRTYGRTNLTRLPAENLLSLGIPVKYVTQMKDLNPGESLSDLMRYPQAY